MDTIKIAETFAKNVAENYVKNLKRAAVLNEEAVLELEQNHVDKENSKAEDVYLIILPEEDSDGELRTYGDDMSYYQPVGIIDDISEEESELRELALIDNSITRSTMEYLALKQDEDILRENLVDEIVTINEILTPREGQEKIQYQVNGYRGPGQVQKKSSSLFEIPVVEDFDSFEPGTFSNVRQRIPRQFDQFVVDPWSRNYFW